MAATTADLLAAMVLYLRRWDNALDARREAVDAPPERQPPKAMAMPTNSTPDSISTVPVRQPLPPIERAQ